MNIAIKMMTIDQKSDKSDNELGKLPNSFFDKIDKSQNELGKLPDK